MWSSFFSAAFRLMRTPSNKTALLDLGDSISLSGWFQKSLHAAKAQGGVELSRNASERIPNLHFLKAKSPETLGFQFAQFLETNGLTEFRSPRAPQDELEWLRERSRVIHDLLHVILDYGIGVEDEIKLNAHLAFSIGLPISCLIVGGGLLRILVTKPLRFPELAREVLAIRSRVAGKRCLILEPLEDWLDLAVSEVRRRVSLEPN